MERIRKARLERGLVVVVMRATRMGRVRVVVLVASMGRGVMGVVMARMGRGVVVVMRAARMGRVRMVVMVQVQKTCLLIRRLRQCQQYQRGRHRLGQGHLLRA